MRAKELDTPGVLDQPKTEDPALGAAIDRYIAKSRRSIGRTKAEVLQAIKGYALAALPCSAVTRAESTAFITGLGEGHDPSALGNHRSHRSAVMTSARRGWGWPLDPEALEGCRLRRPAQGLGRPGEAARAAADARRARPANDACRRGPDPPTVIAADHRPRAVAGRVRQPLPGSDRHAARLGAGADHGAAFRRRLWAGDRAASRPGGESRRLTDKPRPGAAERPTPITPPAATAAATPEPGAPAEPRAGTAPAAPAGRRRRW
ncbi:hypothetical protein SAMN05216360_105105 [Methylobacterium phyllostachyos]|uniref:Uncharacterized protein n=1 Tax=Methylobacterium phyllostachyos TaxID=582672 RepID=A0A1G9XZP3_9HYPH|nr:hypothetical protein SAMN05216360_105105 [Methylobacterium phyllostachyos]